ncbi:MAG: ATP-dependent DNA helicase RecG [Desulfurispora sp.]|uniref:ATP-dependent DNA helicase RecG n=1 Tax=Desulfurispora sp. TaxID=3014275 RepID=UPI00404AC30F
MNLKDGKRVVGLSGELWQLDIRYIKQIGPKMAALLHRLEIFHLGDLFYHFPRQYEDRRLVKTVDRVLHGEIATMRGRVVEGSQVQPRPGLSIQKFTLQDEKGCFVAQWFNQPYLLQQFPPGAELVVCGRVEFQFGCWQMAVSDYDRLDDGSGQLNTGRVVPVYALTGRLTQRYLRRVIAWALQEYAGRLPEFLPGPLRQKYTLPGLEQALWEMHFPTQWELHQQARRRFIFEELLMHQLLLEMKRRQAAGRVKPFRYDPQRMAEEVFLARLPFALTSGQQAAWQEIKSHMLESHPMRRLLQGDVGCGKTMVAMLAVLLAAQSGLQAAVMAPTEILARQHYQSMQRFLAPCGVKLALLIGSTGRSRRQALLQAVRAGEIDVLVGTHALIQEDVEFNALALVIIDEQHRFGVRQRALLEYKGYSPDLLVMTATPIPRTMALTLYGDLEVSTIRELPPGRQPVRTVLLSGRQAGEAYRAVREQVRRGRQAYVVCPLVEESEKLDLQAAENLYQHLAHRVLPDCRLALLHGRMAAREKERVMDAFQAGEVDVLVSTTVVEVGVDVPNATVMVVVDAERFGLAQLHQLRGRVGRGREAGYCFLLSSSRSPEALARLQALVETADGFALAEKDLALRGPGEPWGVKQTGVFTYRLADPVRHIRALLAARQAARELLEDDPDLQSPACAALRQRLFNIFQEEMNFGVIN